MNGEGGGGIMYKWRVLGGRNEKKKKKKRDTVEHTFKQGAVGPKEKI